MALTADELRSLFLFAEFDDDQTAWLLGRAEEFVAEGDGILVDYQDPPTLNVLLDGELEICVMVGGRERTLASSSHPGVYGGGLEVFKELGLIEHHVPMRVRARPGSRLIRLDAETTRTMIAERYPVVTHFLAGMEAMRRYVAMVGEHEKLASLGKVSAGLAHELNNPAAAAGRSASVLAEEIGGLVDVSRAAASLDPGAVDRLRASCRDRTPLTHLDAIERSAHEEEVAEALEAAGVQSAWEMAGDLVESGCDANWLESIPNELTGTDLETALRVVVAEQRVGLLLRDLRLSIGRISELIDAMKDFSHRDRAPDAEVDIHQGIETTLTISAHQIPPTVRIVREYDPDLPQVPGHAGELNQVWSNLIGNAVHATRSGGSVTIRTEHGPSEVTVTVADDGPGIPDDVRDRVFDPFFTTKDVGEGTGLGLDIVRRVVEAHHGRVEFETSPNGTSFRVHLPLEH